MNISYLLLSITIHPEIHKFIVMNACSSRFRVTGLLIILFLLITFERLYWWLNWFELIQPSGYNVISNLEWWQDIQINKGRAQLPAILSLESYHSYCDFFVTFINGNAKWHNLYFAWGARSGAASAELNIYIRAK